MRRLVAIAMLAAGCTADAAPGGGKVPLSEVGLESSSLDRSVDPCVDFYQYACGGWLAAYQIPPDRARWSRLAEIEERTTAAVRSLLDDAAKGIGADAATKKLGDFYASCMDETSIETGGLSSLEPLLAKTTKVKDARSWLAAVATLHQLGIWVVWSEVDAARSATRMADGELGLPDRAYYLEAAHKDVLESYRAHVGRMLGLALPSAKPTGADDVVAVETELARHTDALDAKALRKLRAKLRHAQWSSYFTYHALAANAFGLPRAFDAEMFELHKLLTGVPQQPERSKRCIVATEAALGELIGQQYVSRYVPTSARQTAGVLVDAIAKALADHISRGWMSEPAKSAAQAKLGKLARTIGFPEKWRASDFEIKRNDFAGNRMRAIAAETRRTLARVDAPIDRSEWTANTFDVRVTYDARSNAIVVPSGILQTPLFGAERGVPANLGAIGMLISHELVHAVDARGAAVDGRAWTPEDSTQFSERAQCVSAQYAGMEAARGQFVDGPRTRDEAVADLAGVRIAFTAYRNLRAGAKPSTADGFTEDQQFFLGVAQAACAKERPIELLRRLATDPHAPPKLRIYGALRNMHEFASAFRCGPGTPMNPAKTCSVL